MKKSPLVIIVSLLLFFASCKDDDGPTIDPKVTALTDSLTAIIDNSPLAGFAVTVVKDDKIAYQESFGMANIAGGKKYENNTTQPIGSISKTFIAAALMKAVEQGHFTLETDINDLLPFNITNPYSSDVPIKVKHLTTHTSGLIDEEDTYSSTYYMLRGEFAGLTATMQAMMESFGLEEGDGVPLADFMEAYYTPDGELYSEDNFGEYSAGEESNYSNIAASLSAYIIEAKTGMIYSEYVKQHIFDPLDMSSSAYKYSDLDLSRSAALYFTKSNPYPKYRSFSYPDGFLNTSNEDMGKYLLEMIKGKDGKGTILSDESYQILFKRNPSPDDINLGFGVFWEVNTNSIAHDGGDPGVAANLLFDPVNKTGYFIMTNIDTDSDDGEEISRLILKIEALVSVFEKE